MHERFRATLADLADRHQLRRLTPASGVDFSSNDYLGLARHEGIRRRLGDALAGGIALGSGGSRLLRGNHPEHEELEHFAADFFGAEAALFMATGYLANLALFVTLPGRGDLVLFDERIHASVKEGIHAGFARHAKFAHNDATACEDALARWRRQGGKGAAWIAVESVYSMDGDVAPLADFLAVAERHGATLIVDEAHATGVHGPDGRGFAADFEGRENVIALHTCGKALGQAGALVTLSAVLRDYLVNCARSFVYTTAPPPLAAVAVRFALEVVQGEPERRQRLYALVARARAALGPDIPGGTQILPLILGTNARTVAAQEKLQAQGFDVRAVRAPTVPEGTARLRLSITLNATAADVDRLAAAVSDLDRGA